MVVFRLVMNTHRIHTQITPTDYTHRLYTQITHTDYTLFFYLIYTTFYPQSLIYATWRSLDFSKYINKYSKSAHLRKHLLTVGGILYRFKQLIYIYVLYYTDYIYVLYL